MTATGYPQGMATTRPGPVRWVQYAFGGRLPDRYREWVLHDATDRGWLWRYALRVTVQALPFVVAVVVVLTLFTSLPIGWTLGAAALALAMSLYFTLTSADELVEARLVKQGFPPGTGKEIRKEWHQ